MNSCYRMGDLPHDKLPARNPAGSFVSQIVHYYYGFFRPFAINPYLTTGNSAAVQAFMPPAMLRTLV